jgi:hypothetical protein
MQVECKSKSEIFKQLLKSGCIDNKQLFNKQPQMKKNVVEEVVNIIDIPDDWMDIESNKDAQNILNNRKIFEAPFLPKKWSPYYSKKTKRIVLPWFNNDNKIVYYQLRKIYDNNDSPKYLFPKNTTKKVFTVNYDKSFPYLFLHEGLLDAIFCKNSAVIGGISLTDYQEHSLENLKLYNTELVWFLDNQRVDESSYNATIKLIEKKQKVFIWPKNIINVKDINEYYVKYNDNPFKDEKFLLDNTFEGAMPIDTGIPVHLNTTSLIFSAKGCNASSGK